MIHRRVKVENIYELNTNDNLRKVKQNNAEVVELYHKWEKIQNVSFLLEK